MSFTDTTLTCRDCREQFVFTSGEQEFFAEKGFTNQPTRCPSCRRAAKAQRSGDSNGSSWSSGSSERTMHPATCDSCGKETMVPFVPRNDKPVYCSDCFASRREQSSSRGSQSYNRW